MPIGIENLKINNCLIGHESVAQTGNLGSVTYDTFLCNSTSTLSLNVSNGIITALKGHKYLFIGNPGEQRFSSTSGYSRLQWYSSYSSAGFGQGCGGDGAPTSTIASPIAIGYLDLSSATADSNVSLKNYSNNSLNSYGYGGCLPWFWAICLS
jgi:hypothetical protein